MGVVLYGDRFVPYDAPAFRSLALTEEWHSLSKFFDELVGKSADPLSGNPVMVSWPDGLCVARSFWMLRDHPDSPLHGLDMQRIWDDNGRLFFRGDRDGSSVDLEVRQLSDKGASSPLVQDVLEQEWSGVAAYTPNDRMFGRLEGLWEDPTIAIPPNYADLTHRIPDRPDRSVPLDPSDPLNMSLGSSSSAGWGL